MAQLTIPPSINDARSQALLDLIERLDALELTQILVYRLDSAPDTALLPLAWQFDMLAPQWQLSGAQNESIDALTSIDSLTNIDTLSSRGGVAGVSDADSWRTLLKAAIPLHRTRGTPYAVKSALGALGWTNVTLQEGQSSWGGASYPANQGWAVFRVAIALAAGQSVSSDAALRIVDAVDFFKPARALLDSIWFMLHPLVDAAAGPSDLVINIFAQTDAAPAPADVIAAAAWSLNDAKEIAPYYDGHFVHTGVTYGANEPSVADSGVVLNGSPIAAAD